MDSNQRPTIPAEFPRAGRQWTFFPKYPQYHIIRLPVGEEYVAQVVDDDLIVLLDATVALNTGIRKVFSYNYYHLHNDIELAIFNSLVSQLKEQHAKETDSND